MWVRVDPEMQWLRQLNPTQSDTTWINLLQFERDAIGQLQVRYPTSKTTITVYNVRPLRH